MTTTCARCAQPITSMEDRHVLHHHGGTRIFSEIPFHGWEFHESCFAEVVEGLEKLLREERVEEAEQVQ